MADNSFNIVANINSSITDNFQLKIKQQKITIYQVFPLPAWSYYT